MSGIGDNGLERMTADRIADLQREKLELIRANHELQQQLDRATKCIEGLVDAKAKTAKTL